MNPRMVIVSFDSDIAPSRRVISSKFPAGSTDMPTGGSRNAISFFTCSFRLSCWLIERSVVLNRMIPHIDPLSTDLRVSSGTLLMMVSSSAWVSGITPPLYWRTTDAMLFTAVISEWCESS